MRSTSAPPRAQSAAARCARRVLLLAALASAAPLAPVGALSQDAARPAVHAVHAVPGLEDPEAWFTRLRAIRERLQGEPAGRPAAREDLGAFLAQLRAHAAERPRLHWKEARALSMAAYFLAYAPAEHWPEGAEALDLLREGVDAFGRVTDGGEPLEDVYGEAWAVARLGERLYWEGRLGEARACLAGALERYEDEPLAAPVVVVLLTDLAELERLAGSWDAAQTRLDEAEALLDQLRQAGESDPDDLREAELSLAQSRSRVLIELGLLDRAAPLVRRVRQLADARGSDAAAAAALIDEASLALARGDMQALARELTAALGSMPALADDRLSRAQVQQRLGIALRHLVPSGKATAAAASVAFRAALGHPQLPKIERLSAHLGLASLALEARDHPAAEAALRAAAEETGRIVRGEGLRQPVPESALLAALQAELAVDRGDPPAVLAARLEELQRAYQHFLADWSSTPLREGGVGFLTFASRSQVLASLVRALLLVHGRERGAELALERLLEAQSLGTLARSERVQGADLQRVRELLLRDGAGYLVYLPGPSRSYAFALDAEGVDCSELPGAWATESLQEGWTVSLAERARLGGGALLDPLPAGRELARALLPEDLLARARGWTTVGIVGADLLGDLPFEALPVRGRDGGPSLLGLELPVFHLPSLVLGCWLAEREQPPVRDSRLLVLAAPRPPTEVLSRWPDVGGLEWPRARTRGLRSVYGGAAEVLSGSDASWESWKARAERCDVLQIVTHGVHDPREERSTAFVLSASGADDGRITAGVVERGAAPRVVVLAVCEGLGGPRRSGDDGAAHFGGAFLRAGAQVVLLSPLELELEATLDLLERFHARLRLEGEAPARALLEARREAFAQDPLRSWEALVQVVGLGDRPPLAAAQKPAAARPRPAGVGWGSRSAAGGLVLALLGLLAGLLAWRFRTRGS